MDNPYVANQRYLPDNQQQANPYEHYNQNDVDLALQEQQQI